MSFYFHRRTAAGKKREQVQQIPIDELHPFTNHPFKVVDDEAMTRTVESIAQFGVLAPLIARPRPDGDGYEIISGHRRQYAPLRAMLNGKLQSVSEDIYDSFILREIAEQPEQFKMAIVIGNVLGKYQLGISDVWISNRIDKMLEDGVLEIIQDAPKGETNYRRILRKRMK